ncbi:MAG: hypothetical protein ABEK50_14635, partial [bacterium]
GGAWTSLKATSYNNWAIDIPVGSSSRDYTVEVVAWTGAKIGSPQTFGPVEYTYIEPTVPNDYEDGNVPVTVSTIESKSVGDLNFPYTLY